jgi:hypothetical protein
MFTLKDYETIPVKAFSKPSLGYHKVTCTYSRDNGENVELQSNAFSTRYAPFHVVAIKKDFTTTGWFPKMGDIVEVKYVDNNLTISKTTLLSRILSWL